MNPRDLTGYFLKSVADRLNSINIKISLQQQRPFPKPKERLLSYYTYSSRKIKINKLGHFNRARLVTSLIDFSFIRPLVADAYPSEGGDFIARTRARTLKLSEAPGSVPLDKEMLAYAKCPKGTLPNDVKPPSIQVCAWKLLPYNLELVDEKGQTARLFGIEEGLKKNNLMLVVIRSNTSKIELNLVDNPVYVRCPRMPYDLDTKVSYRRSKHNPSKKERVFGYQVVISTSIEPETGLEIPVACVTKLGSAHDGNYFVYLKEQLKWQHPYFRTCLDIGDCGFDETKNYNYARAEGSIPIFDYNVRSEKLTRETLYQRGYNQEDRPYASYKAFCHPNRYDSSFTCSKKTFREVISSYEILKSKAWMPKNRPLNCQ